eukprot:6357947-Amphidinium_carterae.3
MEFRHALSHITHVAYYYLAFTIEQLVVRDKDADTLRGMAVRQLFHSVATVLNDDLMFGNVVVAMTMFDAHHFVCIVKPIQPLAHRGISIIAGQAAQILDSIFKKARQETHTREQRIHFIADMSKCLFFSGEADGEAYVAGGMRGAPRPADLTPSGHRVLFVPGSEVIDSLMHCVRWVLMKEGWNSQQPASDTHVHLRLVARMWLANAHKQHWLVAGKLVDELADEADTSVCDFLDNRCCPHALSAPAYVIIYALSCLYQVQLFVIDRRGHRVDGYLAVSGWAFQWLHSSWVVVSPCKALLGNAAPSSVPIVISPTQPALDQDLDSEDLFHLIHGAGHCRLVDASLHTFLSGAGRSDTTVTTPGTSSAEQATSNCSHNMMVPFPAWAPVTEDGQAQQTIYVSVSADLPIAIVVPASWTISH